MILQLLFILSITITKSQTETKIELFTSPSQRYIITLISDLQTLSGFCSNCPNYLIIHGWRASQSSWMENMKDELFKTNLNMNVFVVDWGFGSDVPSVGGDLFGYETAVRNINITFRQLHAAFEQFANKNFLNKIDSSTLDLHCIGHSLGGHVCGLTARLMKQKTGFEFNKISAMDPAGPCFDVFVKTNRLDKGDAKFVDVIHTSKALGFNDPLGHVDFYPNEGTRQPGCYLLKSSDDSNSRSFTLVSAVFCDKTIDFALSDETIKKLVGIGNEKNESMDLLISKSSEIVYDSRQSTFKFYSLEKKMPVEFGVVRMARIYLNDLFSACSHGRAWKFYLESINSQTSCKFYAGECGNWKNYKKGRCRDCAQNRMGFYSEKLKENSVIYYSKTNSKAPFCVPVNRVISENLNNTFCKNFATKKFCLNYFLTSFLLLLAVWL